MKNFLKILLIIIGVAAALGAALILFLVWASKQPAVRENYYQSVNAVGELEQKYTDKGDFETLFTEFDAEDEKIGKFKVWYPKEMQTSENKYPLVIMANGTGVPASKYQPVFEHLASWGFIVIGNEDASSWDGESSAATLDFILRENGDENSIFYGKVDTDNIGIAGHSQGGVGAVNAVTAQSNGDMYKAMYTASTTHLALADALGWTYDVSDVKIPYFMTAGTLQADAGNEKDTGIAPIWSLKENYDSITADVMKIYARRIGVDHGQMLSHADGYMTAWFMYHLHGDEEAAKVFLGENAEILENTNWSDVTKNK